MHMLALLGRLLLALGTFASAIAANLVVLPYISPTPDNISQTLDRALASLSIEPAFLTSFGGNNSNPNELTRQLMQRLVERTGMGPDIRLGGTTMWALHILSLPGTFLIFQFTVIAQYLRLRALP